MSDLFEGPVGRIIRMVMIDAHDKQAAQVQFDITDSSIIVRYGPEGSRRDFLSAPSKLSHELVRQLHQAANSIPGQEGQLHLQKPGERISFAVRFQATTLGQEVILELLT